MIQNDVRKHANCIVTKLMSSPFKVQLSCSATETTWKFSSLESIPATVFPNQVALAKPQTMHQLQLHVPASWPYNQEH